MSEARPHAVIETADKKRWTLGHGDIVGRIHGAALRIDDPRVSEAHAMVSLRGQALKLLGLRGVFEVDGTRSKSIALVAGQRIAFAPELFVEVKAVRLPTHVMALEVPDYGRVLLAGTCSLFSQPHARVEHGYDHRAEAWIWSDGERWLFRLGDGDARPFQHGDELRLGEAVLRATRVALDDAGASATRSAGGLQAPLRLVAHFDTVVFQVAGAPPVTLNGVGARLISELVSFDGPVAWKTLATTLWPDTDERDVLRRRLDVNMTRLRKRLREAGVRSDLVHTDGAGQVQLLLDARDQVEDRT